MEVLARAVAGWDATEKGMTGLKVRDEIWIGVDVGKAQHHACAVDATGKVIFSKRLTNGQADIEALIARAGKAAGRVHWAVDMISGTAGLLLRLLLDAGADVTYVPGRLVNRMAGAYAGEGKTDAKDAFTIAETARLRNDLQVVTDADQVVADLQVLTARREDLMADWVRGVNRLRGLLAAIFPALERAFDYSTRRALVLASGFQTAQAIRDAGAEGLAAQLAAGGVRSDRIPTMVDKALAVAAEQTIALPTEATVAPLIARLANGLLDLDRDIKDLDKRIGGRFAAHPDAARITSVPGFGPILGAQLLADTGGSLTQAYDNPGRLAAHAGLAPVPRDSGRTRGNLHRPKRYHRGLRRVFYLAALSAIRPHGPSRTFYQRKRAEGKLHTQAVIALARRLIDVIWALMRDGREFHHSPPASPTTA
jgi:transposase